jgi:hypothetical protein
LESTGSRRVDWSADTIHAAGGSIAGYAKVIVRSLTVTVTVTVIIGFFSSENQLKGRDLLIDGKRIMNVNVPLVKV